MEIHLKSKNSNGDIEHTPPLMFFVVSEPLEHMDNMSASVSKGEMVCNAW